MLPAISCPPSSVFVFVVLPSLLSGYLLLKLIQDLAFILLSKLYLDESIFDRNPDLLKGSLSFVIRRVLNERDTFRKASHFVQRYSYLLYLAELLESLPYVLLADVIWQVRYEKSVHLLLSQTSLHYFFARLCFLLQLDNPNVLLQASVLLL